MEGRGFKDLSDEEIEIFFEAIKEELKRSGKKFMVDNEKRFNNLWEAVVYCQKHNIKNWKIEKEEDGKYHIHDKNED